MRAPPLALKHTSLWRPALAVALAFAPAVAHPQRAPSAAPTAPPAYDPPRGPGDVLPEPQAPQTECAYDRFVQCQPPSPVRSAWQPAPFEACPPEGRAGPPRGVHSSRVSFSPRETRAAWRAGRRECCYVQFVANACD